jgi:hypothetical protein
MGAFQKESHPSFKAAKVIRIRILQITELKEK